MSRRRIAFVVQRYGEELAGGAEYHCRLIAELLAKKADVSVYTTTALDYLSWANHYPVGETTIRGVRVRRFSTERKRDLESFAKVSRRVEAEGHSTGDEETWMDEQGPFAPALVASVREDATKHDVWIFFSYRYWTTVRAIPCAASRAILAPTAEDDGLYRLKVFEPVFRSAKTRAFNSVEERAMLEATWGPLRGDVVGVGSALPSSVSAAAFRREFNIDGPFLLYVGRVDNNKGCLELFDFFLRFRRETNSALRLVLIGKSILDIPQDPGIVPLGFQPDGVKWNALDACLALAMPSRYESLSMVTLEAFWAERPVLANAHCAVLRGQCRRSGGGLYYASYDEFAEALRRLESDEPLRERMGRSGRAYFEKNYAWDVIESKYERLIDDVIHGTENCVGSVGAA